MLSMAWLAGSTVGSMLAGGELVGEPVDIGESTVVEVVGGTTGSRKGFFDLVGEEKGLERPMVANFWPAKGLVGCVEGVEVVVVVVEEGMGN